MIWLTHALQLECSIRKSFKRLFYVVLMGRKENSLETVELRISTNPVINRQLGKLVQTGRYGKNETEAAERLIAEKIGELIDKGKLTDPEAE